MKSKILSSIYALSPFIVFIGLFIGSGIYFSLQKQENAFYQISASVAILPAIILSIYLIREPLQKTMDIFLHGIRDQNIIIMCLIYLLAGAFGTVLQNTGGVTSIVNLSLNFVSIKATVPALFIISALISTAMGTSMGTIATIGPIGIGIANSLNIPLPLIMGTIIGGAMFGDNLSIISDTSIAATQIHGCLPLEKFKNNLLITIPTMIITIIILTFSYTSIETNSTTIQIGNYNIFQCLPYLVVLILALLGTNVFAILVFGIVLAGIIGIYTIPSYTLIIFSQNILDGYKCMMEILILSLLMGGLSELIKYNGGFAIFSQILDYFTKHKENPSKKMAEGAISAIVSFSDICTANNTVAIIISGKITKEIATTHKISPIRTATIIDLFSCVFQGILPYGAQVLMASSLAHISPIKIVPYVYYCFLLGLAGFFSIVFQLPKNNITKDLEDKQTT